MQLIKLIIMVVLIIGSGMLLYQNQVLNPNPITIWLYPGFEKELLLPVILALTLLCGAMVGFFIGLFQILTQKREALTLRSKVRRLQVELDSLRNQTIDDDIVLSDNGEDLSE